MSPRGTDCERGNAQSLFNSGWLEFNYGEKNRFGEKPLLRDRLFAPSLKTAEMEPAVDVDDLPGRVVEQPIGDGAHGLGDVGAFAHTALGKQARGDPVLVAFSTAAIISVRMIPGRISKTCIPLAARRCA